MRDGAKTKKRRLFWQITGIALLILALAGVYVVHRLRQLPPELMQDIKAGIAARNIIDPDQRFEKFLEGRYGPQQNPTNQDKAFLGFFNPDHIRAMRLLVQHSPANRRQDNINASAKWLQQYRENLTPQQRANLNAQLFSPEGLAMLRRATSIYNSQDVYYRDQTKQVISQLLTTLSGIQSQH